MEFLAELIIEVLLEGVFGLTIDSPKATNWIKTAVFLLISQALTVLFAWLTWTAWQGGNSGATVIGIITLLWMAGTVFGAICKHRAGWKQGKE